MLEHSVALDEQYEDVEGEVGAIDPYATLRAIGKRIDVNVLLVCSRSDP